MQALNARGSLGIIVDQKPVWVIWLPRICRARPSIIDVFLFLGMINSSKLQTLCAKKGENF